MMGIGKHLDMTEVRTDDIKSPSFKNIEAPKEVNIDEYKSYLNQLFSKIIEKNLSNGGNETNSIESKYEGLTDEEKLKIKDETGWSDKIIDYIRSMREYEIYKNARLIEAEFDGKTYLIRTDIDWDRKYETGKYDADGNMIYETNRERVAKGRAPLDENGKPIELHHIGQHSDSPLAELTHEEHRCNGNDTILHDKSIESETHGEGNTWDKERQDYWVNRAKYNEGGNGDV